MGGGKHAPAPLMVPKWIKHVGKQGTRSDPSCIESFAIQMTETYRNCREVLAFLSENNAHLDFFPPP